LRLGAAPTRTTRRVPDRRYDAARDLTVEVPGVPRDGTGPAAHPARAAPEWPDPRMDLEATELPIFRDVATQFAGFFARPAAVPAEPPTPWRGAADDGWAAAASAATPRVARRTETGLPQRDPMAHLVPGAVQGPARGSGAVDYRTPAAVAAAVAAFARGNAHSRALRGQPAANRPAHSSQEPEP
jgi:hypothetical protein